MRGREGGRESAGQSGKSDVRVRQHASASEERLSELDLGERSERSCRPQLIARRAGAPQHARHPGV